MTRHFEDLGSASHWTKQIFNQSKNTTQGVGMLASYRFMQSEASPSHSRLLSRLLSRDFSSLLQMESSLYGLGKPVVASRNVSCLLKLPIGSGKFHNIL